MSNILFLDLDGTVRRTKSGATFINDPHDQELIPGVMEAIARYDLKEWKVIGITNQGGVGAGFKTLENCILEQRQTMKMLPTMDSVMFCPDNGRTMCYVPRQGEHSVITSYDYGSFRKPGYGMIAFFKQYSGEPRPKSLMVGDRPEDEQCAKNANIPFMWAHEWRGDKT